MAKTPEQQKEYLREYNKKNREHIRELKRRYEELHKDELAAKRKLALEKRLAAMTEEQREEWARKRRESVARSYEKHKDKRREDSRVAMSRWRKENPEKFKTWRQDYEAKNREKLRAGRKAYLEANPEKARLNDGMLFLPGQTIEGMRQEQNNKCAICGCELGTGRECHVDHCHKTGYVRALLCKKCNLAIGNADDNPALLRKAADYLDAHAARIEKLERVLNSNHVALVDGRSERPPE